MIINKDIKIGNTNVTLDKLVPVTLFTTTNSTLGSALPITLSDDWNKYEYLEIWGYYGKGSEYYNPRNHGTYYLKMWTNVPYIAHTCIADGHYWGVMFQRYIKATGTRTLESSSSRGRYWGGSNGANNEWWKTAVYPTVFKVIGWKK